MEATVKIKDLPDGTVDIALNFGDEGVVAESPAHQLAASFLQYLRETNDEV